MESNMTYLKTTWEMADVAWSDVANADPVEDIDKAISVLKEEGVNPSRAIMNSKTCRYLRRNAAIKATIYRKQCQCSSG